MNWWLVAGAGLAATGLAAYFVAKGIKVNREEVEEATKRINEKPRVVRTVYCTTQFEAVHNWPDCPIEEVAFLRNPHRHIFHVKAEVFVGHDNRDVEFIQLKQLVSYFCRTKYGEKLIGSKSCEMISQEIGRFLQDSGLSVNYVETSEDGENGAVVRYQRSM